MARMPTESEYISASLPQEMLAEAETGDGLPEGVNVTNEGGLTRVRLERPANIPINPPVGVLPLFTTPAGPGPSTASLVYHFALLPDVQFHGELRGPATADHIEQLVEYLTVAARKMREQEQQKRPMRRGKVKDE